MQNRRQTLFSMKVLCSEQSKLSHISLCLKLRNEILQSHSPKPRKKCLITYDQRLVFSGGDTERLGEFALGLEGGSFSVDKEASTNGRGFLVLAAF